VLLSVHNRVTGSSPALWNMQYVGNQLDSCIQLLLMLMQAEAHRQKLQP
jgi:hypothetical protein